MSYPVKQIERYRFVEEGEGDKTLLLLHGLFGTLSNFVPFIDHFRKSCRVVMPILPLYELDLFNTSVVGLKRFVLKFLNKLGYENVHVLGHSMGGHVGILLSLSEKIKNLKSVILVGSSGLFENGMGDTYPKRNNYEYVKMKTQSIFYDPKFATKELVDGVFDIVNNRLKALKTIYLARSAMRTYMGDELCKIKLPTILIWGMNDIVTPPLVAHEFNKKIVGSELYFIDKCGHVPMLESPDEFNAILEKFLQKH